MKKTGSILLLILAFTFTTQAQKKGGKLKVEQMLKEMTIALNLTEEQENKIKPLLIAQIADRKLLSQKRKELKESGEKPSKEDRKKMKEERMAKETALNSKMSSILNKEQFARFEIIAKEKKETTKKKGNKKKEN
jgi:short subunit dehydrogenase-like uncharacterized protein